LYEEARVKTHGSAAILFVSDLDASLRFYVDVLGFSERFRFGNYAGVEHGEVQIHLSGPGATNRKAAGQGSIYIFCDDVDAYYAEVTAKGAKVQGPPKDYEYGMRDFIIEDPDGNLVGMGQERGG
jgi:catechol 2,3-dioxygenase-like lactoylglutathione lyase family enzyme